jgi:two-component system nitrate/nitrite response regulator NarL
VPTNLLVSHRDSLVADAIRSYLEGEGFHVSVARTVDEIVERAPLAETCLVHMGMREAPAGIRQVVSRPKSPRVFALVDTEQQIGPAVESGANACVTAADGLDRLVHMLRSEIVVTSKASAGVAQRALSRQPAERSAHDLTAREVEVLAGLVRGESTKALAARMNVRPATARTHVQHVLAKLGVHSRLQAVAYLIEHPIDSLSAWDGRADSGVAAS